MSYILRSVCEYSSGIQVTSVDLANELDIQIAITEHEKELWDRDSVAPSQIIHRLFTQNEVRFIRTIVILD